MLFKIRLTNKNRQDTCIIHVYIYDESVHWGVLHNNICKQFLTREMLLGERSLKPRLR